MDLEIEGRRVNYRYERELDRSYFAPAAATLIQRYTRGFLVRNVKWRMLKRASAIKLQAFARKWIARMEFHRRLTARSQRRVVMCGKRLLAQMEVIHMKKEHCSALMQTWYRGRRDRRVAHDLSVKRACVRIALYYGGFLGGVEMKKVKRWY
jgi:hypothetical protein